MPEALTVRALAKDYAGHRALDGVDLTIAPGELFGLLGPNGAGKSTLVKIVCGLVNPSGGDVSVCGHRAGSLDANRTIGYLPELFRYPDWATATEVMRLHQRLTGSHGGDGERRELLTLVGLGNAMDKKVDQMSKGMQQRLGMAQAMIGNPQLLLFDEPTSALDPAGRIAVRELLEELRRRGVAVLLNSHLLSEVERVVDRVAIITSGRVVAAGTPTELSAARGVEIDTATGTQRFPDADREDAPGLVADLVAQGERVYGVRVLRSSLEEIYLEATRETDQ